MKKYLTKNIIILSVVSFFTDVASEMLYPVMPIYLASIGYGAIALGIIDGIAEATAGLNKVFFGYLSDRLGKRNFFVRLGYGISAFAKPLIGFSQNAIFILFIRFLDRIGKGIRTSPRDAILFAESKDEFRGRVFGFHRAADTFGAMLGPVISLAFLYFYPFEYSKLFVFAFVPGALAFFSTFYLMREKKKKTPKKKPQTIKDLVNFWKVSPISYKKLLLGFLFLAIVNSSNSFLLLRAKELQFTDYYVVFSYILYNFVFTVFSFPLGAISDRFGFKPVFIAGLLAFSLTYSLLGQGFSSSALLLLVFAIYGIFGAVEEGMTKAWLTLHIPKEFKATGLGLHLTLNSLGFLAASVLTGVVWQSWGASMAFTLTSFGGIAVLIYFLAIRKI